MRRFWPTHIAGSDSGLGPTFGVQLLLTSWLCRCFRSSTQIPKARGALVLSVYCNNRSQLLMPSTTNCGVLCRYTQMPTPEYTIRLLEERAGHYLGWVRRPFVSMVTNAVRMAANGFSSSIFIIFCLPYIENCWPSHPVLTSSPHLCFSHIVFGLSFYFSEHYTICPSSRSYRSPWMRFSTYSKKMSYYFNPQKSLLSVLL